MHSADIACSPPPGQCTCPGTTAHIWPASEISPLNSQTLPQLTSLDPVAVVCVGFLVSCVYGGGGGGGGCAHECVYKYIYNYYVHLLTFKLYCTCNMCHTNTSHIV